MTEQAELLFWQTIIKDRQAGLPEFRAYLDAYPNGQFAGLARARIERLAPFQPSKPGQAKAILDTVAELGGVLLVTMLSKRRDLRLVRCRQIAMALMRELTTMSYPEIGRIMGARDHTTVLHGCQMIQQMQSGLVRGADAEATLALLTRVRGVLSPSATPGSPDSTSVMAAQ